MEISRSDRKKGKIKKVIFLTLTIMLSLVFVTSVYAYFEYKEGIKEATELTDKSHPPYEDVVFNGVEENIEKVSILLLGIDARGSESSRSDTIMIVQYEPETGTSKIVSIMRDTYVEIPGYKKQKINAAHALGGAELVRKTIKANFDIDVQYYATITFNGFSHLIDTTFPDGIQVEVEKEMSKNIGLTLYPGSQKLNGEELLGYVRFRHDSQSDFGRVERQQEVLSQIADDVTSIKGITKIPKMIGTIQPFIKTNIDNQTILSVGKQFVSDETNIENLRIPIDGSFTSTTYDVGAVLDPDLKENRQALQDFLN
ncbi:transcriptional regulator [Salipaludibacillus neizhouensis]|uniref:Regulatory protein MsrR n=1 Tax=Salipaludibacillus neizhouensis TaxID=885475 RepID=A0A3A9JXF5_9BACI|nr:LCP family protein [Salipaludibacillus neizhouensis]RKL65157.1 transcriptional regulator [Salipaludibacillus neizhouensis]